MPRMVIPPEVIAALSWHDAAALLTLALCWAVMGWLSEHPFASVPSVTVMMAQIRRDWMREYMIRDNRIADTQVVASLRQATAFMASTSVVGVGGVLALIGNVTPITGLAAEVGRAELLELLWQIKFVPCTLLLTHAFLKFMWADRVLAHCIVMMATVPYQASDPRSLPRAMQAAEFHIRAASNFNRGVQSMYFALASLAWLVGSPALLLAAVLVSWSLWRREFAPQPRDVPAQG